MSSLPGVIGGRGVGGMRGGWLRVPEQALVAWVDAQRAEGSRAVVPTVENPKNRVGVWREIGCGGEHEQEVFP
jgi:hypothetical protein